MKKIKITLDKKTKMKLFIFFIYINIIIFLYVRGDINPDIRVIKEQLLSVNHILFWYFMISIFRIVLFIPQSVFIIVGGLLFDPWIAFSLSMIAHAISESIIYFFTKIYFDVEKIQKFILKNTKMINLLKKYQIKLLALGVSCPFAPSDLLASASAIVGIKYIPYVTTVLLAGAPLTFIYSFIGEQVTNDANFNMILIILFVIIFTLLSVKMYKNILKEN